MKQPGRIGAGQKAHKREVGRLNPTHDAVERRLCADKPRLSDLLKEGIASLPAPLATMTAMTVAFANAARPWVIAAGEVVWEEVLR